MELALFVITCLWSFKMSSAIRCYSCEVEHTKSYNQEDGVVKSTPTCDQFTGSDISATDCPESTMCMKRVTTQDIGPGLSSAIRCYSCEVEHTKSYNQEDGVVKSTPTCDQFTGSDISATDCPESTMCMKRVTTQDIGPGLSSKSVRRGCAPQTTKGMQEKVGRKWESVNKIYEVYEEGCMEDPSNEHKLTKTVLCYCRGDLCNTSGKTFILPAAILITLGVMLL